MLLWPCMQQARGKDRKEHGQVRCVTDHAMVQLLSSEPAILPWCFTFTQ